MWLYKWRLNRLNYFQKFNIPTSCSSLIFGDTKSSILKKRNILYDADDVYQKFKGKSPFVGFFVFQTPYILLLDASLMKVCRKFRNNDFEINHKVDPLMALNPFFLKDEQWKQKRRDTDNALSSNKVNNKNYIYNQIVTHKLFELQIKTMLPRVIQSARNLEKYLIKQLAENPRKIFDARAITHRYTCDAISACLYGIDSRAFDDENCEMLKFGTQYIRGIMDSLVSFFPRRMLNDEVVEFFTNTTREAIRLRTEMNNNSIDDMLTQTITLQHTKNYSEEELVAHCLTLFLDSFETAGITLMNCLYHLGKNENIQSKLRVEIIDANLTFETINELPYLDQVFYETLRLHPALPYTTRVCMEDWEIDGMKILKDTPIWIPIHSIHRDPDYYYQPEDFIPERFDDENGGVKSFKDRCELIPFGDGLRICSGMKFAHIVVKTALIEVVKNFKVHVDESTREPLHVSVNEFMHIAEQEIFLRFEKIVR